jgi:CheY-like chemotaxis protein
MESSSSQSPSGRLVLLVDDEALVRFGTALLLEELGYRVLQASTAAQGLQILEDNSDIEILLTDFRMPDLDGLAMIERARKIKPSLSVALMTGYASDDERFAELEIPRLAKPFGIGDIEIVLQQSC